MKKRPHNQPLKTPPRLLEDHQLLPITGGDEKSKLMFDLGKSIRGTWP